MAHRVSDVDTQFISALDHAPLDQRIVYAGAQGFEPCPLDPTERTGVYQCFEL